MRHYACAILLRGGKILLGKRAAHRKSYPGQWDVIGSRIEEGETVEEALRRELKEEIGIVPVSCEPLGNVLDATTREPDEAIYHMHLVRIWAGGEPTRVNDEHSEMTWFSIKDACLLPSLALANYVDIFRGLERKRRRLREQPLGRRGSGSFSGHPSGKGRQVSD